MLGSPKPDALFQMCSTKHQVKGNNCVPQYNGYAPVSAVKDAVSIITAKCPPGYPGPVQRSCTLASWSPTHTNTTVFPEFHGVLKFLSAHSSWLPRSLPMPASILTASYTLVTSANLMRVHEKLHLQNCKCKSCGDKWALLSF